MPNPPDHRITIRLKPDEYALVKVKAGDKQLAPFIRELLLEKAAGLRKTHKATPIKDHRALAQVLALLGQHKLLLAFKKAKQDIGDGTQPADDECKALLMQCHDLLTKIHKLLMRALGVAER